MGADSFDSAMVLREGEGLFWDGYEDISIESRRMIVHIHQPYQNPPSSTQLINPHKYPTLATYRHHCPTKQTNKTPP